MSNGSIHFFVLFLFASFFSVPKFSLADTAPDDKTLYIYKAKITNVYDADTVTAEVDLGFYVWLHDERFRLSGIAAPEVTGVEKERGIKCRPKTKKGKTRRKNTVGISQ